MARLFYSGDINAEHGGFFYSLQNMPYDYANVLRIVPCSDADGPENVFWIERLTVNIRKGDKLQSALDCCGVSAEEYAKATRSAKMHIAIECCLNYGYYDTDFSEVVQVGAKVEQRSHGYIHIDKIIRGNSSIGVYARKAAHAHCD